MVRVVVRHDGRHDGARVAPDTGGNQRHAAAAAVPVRGGGGGDVRMRKQRR